MISVRVFFKRLVSYLSKVLRLFFKDDPIGYWKRRSKQLGGLAVLDKRHKHDEIVAVTEYQVRQIFPHLKLRLTPAENTLLDFGCGTGRFMPYFRELISGKIIGVDPVESLITLAPAIAGVEYKVIKGNTKIPVDSKFADIVWICLVLGGINDSKLAGVISELLRVAKKGALVCLVENTSAKNNAPHWTFREKDFYQKIFPGSKLNHVNDYYDFDEQISVFVGRIN